MKTNTIIVILFIVLLVFLAYYAYTNAKPYEWMQMSDIPKSENIHSNTSDDIIIYDLKHGKEYVGYYDNNLQRYVIYTGETVSYFKWRYKY